MKTQTENKQTSGELSPQLSPLEEAMLRYVQTQYKIEDERIRDAVYNHGKVVA